MTEQRQIESALVQQADRRPERSRGKDDRQLVADALGSDEGDGLGAFANGRLRCGLDVEAKPHRHAHGLEQPQRVVIEIGRIDHPHQALLEVAPAAVRIEQRAGSQRHRHGVDREVAAGQIAVDVAVEDLREIEHVRAGDDAPGTEVVLAEADDFPAERSRAGQRIEAGHVDVARCLAAQEIANGAADDPGIRVECAQIGEQTDQVVAQRHRPCWVSGVGCRCEQRGFPTPDT